MNMKEGYGVFNWKEGDVICYEGDWVADKMEVSMTWIDHGRIVVTNSYTIYCFIEHTLCCITSLIT